MTAEQAQRLGKDLTPLGGERAGNADGTIPAEELISDVVPLQDTAAAVERLDSGENVVKVLIASAG